MQQLSALTSQSEDDSPLFVKPKPGRRKRVLTEEEEDDEVEEMGGNVEKQHENSDDVMEPSQPVSTWNQKKVGIPLG